MIEETITCTDCEVEFNIAYIDDEAQVCYCPFCSSTIVTELDFND